MDWWLASSLHPVLVDDGGEEELRGNRDAAYILAAMIDYTAARRAALPTVRIVGMTTPPATAAWWSAGQDVVRQEVNDAILSNPDAYGYDQIVDVASIPGLQDPADPVVTSDGIHFTQASAALVANELVAEGV